MGKKVRSKRITCVSSRPHATGTTHSLARLTHSHDSQGGVVEALAARRVGVPEGGGGALRLGLDVQRHEEDDRDEEAEDHREERRERNFEADRAAICRGAELCQRGNGVSGGCVRGGCVSGGIARDTDALAAHQQPQHPQAGSSSA